MTNLQTQPSDEDRQLASRILRRIGLSPDVHDIKAWMAADEIKKVREERSSEAISEVYNIICDRLQQAKKSGDLMRRNTLAAMIATMHREFSEEITKITDTMQDETVERVAYAIWVRREQLRHGATPQVGWWEAQGEPLRERMRDYAKSAIEAISDV